MKKGAHAEAQETQEATGSRLLVSKCMSAMSGGGRRSTLPYGDYPASSSHVCL